MRTGGRGGALLLGAALGMMGCADGPVGPGATDGPASDRPPSESGSAGPGDGSSAPACAWDVVAPELKLPESDLQGVLRGSSRNASTTCTRLKGTGGPESFYLLRLTERTLVDLEVISDLDTVLAIRRACDDPLTEVACSDGSGDDGAWKMDAGVPAPAPDPVDAGMNSTRDAHLRASLPAGVYYLLVDEAEPSGMGGEFQLRLRTSPPPTQTTCAAAATVSDGTRLLAEELDLASERPPCGDETARPALFYRAVIPAGARITARALPASGDRPWTPALRVFTSCAASGNLCLASDQAGPEGQRELRYVNNGPTEQAVLLSVSATERVTGAVFGLEVRIAQPMENLTCQSALPLSDGLVLRNQDLSDARHGASPTCGPLSFQPDGPKLYYSARLYPRQSVRVTADPPGFVGFAVREGCGSVSCLAGNFNDFHYINTASEARTVFIEANTSAGGTLPPFDLRVQMPLPPAEISALPDRGLVTTEAAGQATFRVVLTTPATEVVEIPFRSSDPDEGTVSPSVLRFSPLDWDRPQTVTVTGVDDSERDGTRPYLLEAGPSTSADPRYQGVEAKVALSNHDDEPGFGIEAPAPLVTSESGAATVTFRVYLNRAPAATVRLPLSSSDDTEAKVRPSELVFEPDSWSKPRTVTVLGLDDDEQDGSQRYQVVVGPASSDDPDYQGIDPADLAARNADDEFPRVAGTPLNPPTSCYYPSNQILAVDGASTLYAGMVCHGIDDRLPAALVAASTDGGRSFGAPVNIGLPVHLLALAAGRPGLIVAAGYGPYGILITRSEDGGATWAPMQVLDRMEFISTTVLLSAAGDRVVVYNERGPLGPSYWISDDGGRTFTRTRGAFGVLAVGVDADGTLWSFGFDYVHGGLSFRSSSDGGVTFTPGLYLPFDSSSGAFAAGPNLLYTADKELQVVPRDGSVALHPVATVPPSGFSGDYQPRPLLVADGKDNVVVLVLTANHQAEAHRLNAGETTFAAAKVLGPSMWVPGVVALSDRAIAVALVSDDGRGLSVAVETWP